MSMAADSAPVTRGEFKDALGELERKIDELFKAKQVSWPLIVSIGALLVVVLGAGIANWIDSATTREIATSNRVAISDILNGPVSDFRERIRATEAHAVAMQTENETQHKAIADVLNLKLQEQDRLLKLKFPDWPMATYWPLHGIGGADSINGKGK